MIDSYKRSLEHCYQQLKQPDITQIPWKFVRLSSLFFEHEIYTVPVCYEKQKEVVMCDIVDFFRNYPQEAQKYIVEHVQKFPFKDTWNMHAHLYAQKKWVIYIKPETKIKEPLMLALQDACVEHITIIVREGAHVSLHEKMFAEHKRIKNVDVIIEKNALLTFSAQHTDVVAVETYLHYRFFVYQDAQLTGHFALQGGKTTIALIDLFMCASGAAAHIKGYYLLDGSRQTIVVTGQHHMHKQTFSNVSMKGIVADAAHAVYYGTIEIAKNAPQTEAYQENKNIVLSEQAKVFSQPNLEIKTDDVRCKHGSAIGKFDADQLLYMQARGFSVQASQKLLLETFIADMLHPNIEIAGVFHELL